MHENIDDLHLIDDLLHNYIQYVDLTELSICLTVVIYIFILKLEN